MAIRRYGLDQLRALSRLPAALQEPPGVPKEIRTAAMVSPLPPPPPPLPASSPASPPPTTTPPPPPPPPGRAVRVPPPTAVHANLRPLSPVPVTLPRKALNVEAMPFRPAPAGLRPTAKPFRPTSPLNPSSPPTVLPAAVLPAADAIMGRVLSTDELWAASINATPFSSSPYTSGRVSPLKDDASIPPPPPLLSFPDVPEVELGAGLRDRS